MAAEPFVIRESTPDDFDLICAHRCAMFEDMGRDTPEQINAMDVSYRAWLAERLTSGEYRAWFVESAGRVVAGAGLWLLQWPPSPYDQSRYRGYILNVYTEPDFRRRGLAKRLMAQVIAWCRANDIRVIALHASDEGRMLYASLGFQPTHEMRIQFPISSL